MDKVIKSHVRRVRKFHEVPHKPIVPTQPVEKEFRLVRDSHGNCSYIEVGEKNVQDYIQSFTNGCSLKAILDRCSLLPTREKIAYLNQTDAGFSADLTHMPKDGTEAQILLSKVKKVCPDFASRLKNGESFEKILSEYVQPKQDPAPAVEKIESEVTSNG